MFELFKNRLRSQFRFSPSRKLSRDDILYRVVPHLFVEIVDRYLRVEVEGIENIPKRAPALIIANHSGFSGYDAVILAHEILKAKGRILRMLAHPLWFVTPHLSVLSHKLGMEQATKENGLELLKKKHLVLLFPEGEEGNFKPTRHAYRLQEFKRGFIRMAMEMRVPIIPTSIIGAEETHINLAKITWVKPLLGTVLPLPLNMFPLPARWKIKFLSPVPMRKYSIQDAANRELVHQKCRQVRHRIQRGIVDELRIRQRTLAE